MSLEAMWREFLATPILVFLAGMLTCWLLNALVLPDNRSSWLHARRNVPTVLLPLGVVALVIAAAAIILGLAQAMVYIRINPAVWLLLAAGLIILILWFATRRRRPHA